MNDILPSIKHALLSMQRLSWEQGLAAQAFFACGEPETGVLLCLEAIHRRIPEGNFSIGETANLSAEPGTCGIPFLWAHRETGEPMFSQAAQDVYAYYSGIAPKNSDGIAHCHSRQDPESFWEEPLRIRTDALYHIAPFLAAMGKADEALSQFQAYRSKLYDPADRLYRQSWDDRANAFDDSTYTARANGWAAAALTDMLRALPEAEAAGKGEASAHLNELIDSVLQYQGEDSMFHAALCDPESAADCTASCMVAYAVLRTVSAGILDDTYIRRAEKAMAVVAETADRYGVIQSRRDEGAESGDVASQAFYLLANAALRDCDRVRFALPAIHTRDDAVLEKVKRSLLAMQRLSWEQGCAAQAFFEIGDVDMGILMAKEAVRRQLPDGRLGIVSDNYISADPGACGEPVLMAAKYTGDRQFLDAASRLEDYFLHKAPRSAEGVIALASGKDTEWSKKAKHDIVIDAVYHTAPFLAAIGNYGEAINQLLGCRKVLFAPETGLYYQVWERDASRRFNKWGAGMGWMAGAYVRVIRMLPDEMRDEKKVLSGYLKEILDGVLVWQRQDGLFHNMVDDMSDYYEAVAGEMLGYAIYRGILAGILGEEYRKPADRMREGALKMINGHGIVCNQHGIPQFAAEGNAFFILLEAAYRDLSRS